MAGSTKTITLKFTGDVDDLVAKVGEADGALKLLNTSAGNTDGFDKLSKDSGKAADDVTEKWAGTATKWTSIIVGALGVGAPLVAGAATALGVAAIGAIGVALVKGSDDVKNSWNDLTQTFLNEGQQSASVITGPISTALDDLSTLVVREKPNLDNLFSGAATDIPPLEQGIESLVNGAMPGLVSLFQNSKPIISGVGTVLGAVGNAVGTVFQDISNNAPLIEKDLDNLAPTIQNLGSILGNLITIGSEVGTVVNPELTGLSTLLTDVTEIVSGQYAPKYDYNNPIFGTGGVVGTIAGKFLDDGNAAAIAKKPIDDMLTTIANLGGGSVNTAVNVGDLTTDITALNTSTTNAKQSAQAFSDILAAFGQSGQQQVNSFIGAASADLDNMASAFKGVGKVAVDAAGNFDVTTKSGQALQTQLVGAQSDIGSVAGAMREAGDSTAAINDKVTQFDNNLEKNLMNDLHLTKGQADALITQFGLWPNQIDTKIGIIDEASPLAKAIGGEINNIPDHNSHITTDAIQAGESVLGLSNQIFGLPDGYTSMYADVDPAQSQINNLINSYNGRRITLAVNAVTNLAQSTINAITGGRATGGPVWRGNSYLVGENGPEWFTPNASGSITSNSDTANGTDAASAAPRTIEIPINLSDQIGVVVQAQIDANFRVISQKVKAGVR
jgi:hypothetical protein